MRGVVFLGMSGGVDSSLSAVLLKEQGYRVVGVYMKNWSKNLPGMKCPWAEDLADAKRVAVRLGIDFRVFDFEAEYKNKVVDYMLEEFKKGNTPNPDIMCNQEIKFKLFYDVAMEQGADFIATGHYARIGECDTEFSSAFARLAARGEPQNSRAVGVGCPHPSSSGREPKRENIVSRSPVLLKAVDENKDQTYFLYRISEEALEHTIFPVGGMLKQDVKKLAAEKGLDNAYKKESMGVCFVGEVGMKDFLKEYLKPGIPGTTPGEFKDTDTGEVLGLHEGAIFYTIGQRKGLKLGGGLPYYVVKKDIKNNIVYVSRDLNSADLWTDTLRLKDVVIRRDANTSSSGYLATTGARNRERARNDGPRDRCPNRSASFALNLDVRLRHRAPLIPATFDGETVKFKEKIKAPAPGQSVVFYDGDICLGGGIVK